MQALGARWIGGPSRWPAGRCPTATRAASAAAVQAGVGLAEPGRYDKLAVSGPRPSRSTRWPLGLDGEPGGSRPADARGRHRTSGHRRRRGAPRRRRADARRSRRSATRRSRRRPPSSGRRCGGRSTSARGWTRAAPGRARRPRRCSRSSCPVDLSAACAPGPAIAPGPDRRRAASSLARRDDAGHPGLHAPRRPRRGASTCGTRSSSSGPRTASARSAPRAAPPRRAPAVDRDDRPAAAHPSRAAATLQVVATTSSSSAAASTAWPSPTSSPSAASRDVAVLERWLPRVGRQRRATPPSSAPTTAPPQGVAFYDESVKLYERLSVELGFNVLFSQHGHLTLAHTELGDRRPARPGRDEPAPWASTAGSSDPTRSASSRPALDLSDQPRFPILAALYHPPGGIIRHDAVVWGYARRAQRAGRRDPPVHRGHRHRRRGRPRHRRPDERGPDPRRHRRQRHGRLGVDHRADGRPAAADRRPIRSRRSSPSR